MAALNHIDSIEREKKYRENALAHGRGVIKQIQKTQSAPVFGKRGLNHRHSTEPIK